MLRMAVVVRAPIRRVILLRFHSLPRTVWRLEHSSAATDATDDGDGTDNEEPKMPMVPKKRDPNAVLKALASTVSPLEFPLLMGGTIANPLAPWYRGQHLEYMRAREAGKMAAQYVIRRWPDMFPERKPEPDLIPKTVAPKGLNEDTLKYLIANRKTSKALKMYRKLQEKGEPVSLETQNELLALLAYFGLGNPWVKNDEEKKYATRAQRKKEGQTKYHPSASVAAALGLEAAAETREDLDHEKLREVEGVEGKDEDKGSTSESSESDDEDTSSSEEEEEEEERKGTELRASPPMPNKYMKQVWSLDNHAEQFFAEMTEKNGETYDALISGLVTFKDYDRAFEMFNRMRTEGHQASLETYNYLLSAIADTVVVPQLWKKAKDLTKHMTEEPIVKPNRTTMNLLLQITHKTGTSSTTLAVETMREMAHLGIEPNLNTFLRLLKAYILHADGSILYEITDYLEENQHILTPTEEFDLHFFTVALSAAKLLRDPDLSMRLKNLAMKDNWLLVKNLDFAMSQYLATVAAGKNIDVLKKEYRALLFRVFVPPEWVYGSMFRACEDLQAPHFAVEMWNDAVRRNVKIMDVRTLERFCGALSAKIDPSEVNIFIAALKKACEKFSYLGVQPPGFVISQFVRLHTLIDDLDSAWEYYAYFEKFNIEPTFLALSCLLKGHYGRTDTAKIIEILETMVQRGMFLPTTFVRDICWKVGVDSITRSKLIDGFLKNQSESRERRSRVPAQGQYKRNETVEDM